MSLLITGVLMLAAFASGVWIGMRYEIGMEKGAPKENPSADPGAQGPGASSL